MATSPELSWQPSLRISIAFRHGLREIAYLSDQEYDDETGSQPSES